MFQQICSTCHKIFGEGNAVGPDLTTADRRNIDVLLQNIVNPSAYIRPEFVAYEAETALIHVADQGAGLSPEDLGRLFGRFQRLSAKPTGGESSTGLGLSIVKRIIDMHGGKVTANSAGPGEGSTFTISLPSSPE